MAGMRKLYGRGPAQIDVTDDWFVPFEKLMATVIPSTKAVMTEATRELFENARAQWPVKRLHSYERKALEDPNSSPQLVSWIKRKEKQRGERGIGGYSKGDLEHGWRGYGQTIEVFIRNTSKYSHYITKPWPYNNVKVANELIYKPGKKLAKQLAILMGEELGILARAA